MQLSFIFSITHYTSYTTVTFMTTDLQFYKCDTKIIPWLLLKQIMVVVTIILLLSAYMIQLSHSICIWVFFFEVILEKYCNLCKSCEEQLGIHHTCTPSLLQYTCSEIYGAADSDGKVHSFTTKNALCQLLKLLKIIEVILPFIKKVLKLEPCSIPRTFVRHGPTVKITGEIAKHTGTKKSWQPPRTFVLKICLRV